MKLTNKIGVLLSRFGRTLFAGSLLLGVLNFTSCRQDPPPPPSGGNCEQQGTIEYVPCASGAWGNLWIRTSNGKLLKPCRIMVQGFTPVEGMSISFSAVDPGRGAACIEVGDHQNNCFRAPEYDMLKVITCIKVNGQNNLCNTLATVKQIALDGCKWILVLDNGTKLEPYGIPETFKLEDGMRVSIAYNDNIKVASICMVGRPAQILCIRPVRMCGTEPPVPCTPMEVGHASNNNGNMFTIQKAELSGTCLHVTVGFSGCSDQYRKYALVWDGVTTPGNATDFYKVTLIDRAEPEVCEAYFTKTYSFDVSKILKNAKAGNHQGSINIAGYNSPILFTY